MNPQYSLTFGPFKIEFPRRVLSRNGEEIRLGSRAMEILVALAEASGELVSNQTLVARVWPNTVVDEGSLRVHMSAVRKALDDGQDGAKLILNEMGRGYRLTATVEKQASIQMAEVSAGGRRDQGSLPTPVAQILGRATVVDGLTASLPDRRLMTITGAGGIGKTTVALAIAQKYSSATGAAACFVDFAPVVGAARAASTVAMAIGVAVATDDPVPDIIAAIGDSAWLLVLDNCEHLVDSIATLAERLLRGTSELRLLVTSREPLRAEGEWVHRLAPLAVPESSFQNGLSDALSYPSVALFVERATAANDTFQLVDENVGDVCEVCRQLDGIPLAIEMAAARVVSMDAHTLSVRLADRFALLTRGRRTALPRQQTLRAMLDWSYALLEPRTQEILNRLSVFRSSFDIDAAIAVASCDDIEEFEIFEGATDLVAKSLLVSETERAGVNYRLLETTRHYAVAKLAESGRKNEFYRQHALYCCSLFSDPGPAWEGGAQRENTVVHSKALDDIRAAFDWSSSDVGDPAIVVRLATFSAPLWLQVSQPYEFLKLAERAMAVIGPAGLEGSIDHVQLLNAYGHAIWHTSGPVQAMADAFGKSLEVARALGDPDVQMRSMWGMWSQKLQSGQYAQSLEITQAYQKMAAASEQLATTQTAKHTHALSQERLGNLDFSLNLIEDVLLVDNANPVRAGHANAAQMDGRTAAWTLKMRILWIQGHVDAALELARLALPECIAVDHDLSLCFCLAMGALPVAIWCGDHVLAREILATLRDRTTRNGLRFWDKWANGFEAILDGTEFDVASATVYQLEIFATLGHTPSIEALSRIDRFEVESWCRAELLRCEAMREGMDEHLARRLLEQARKVALEQGAHSWALRIATSEAHLKMRNKDVVSAISTLSAARAAIVGGGTSTDVRNAEKLLLELSSGERENCCR